MSAGSGHCQGSWTHRRGVSPALPGTPGRLLGRRRTRPPAPNCTLRSGLAADGAGNLFIADSYNYRVRRVSSDGIIVTLAGDGTTGNSGDGGFATAAQPSHPISVAVGCAGNAYVAGNNVVSFCGRSNDWRAPM
jgi:hypothetical protein